MCSPDRIVRECYLTFYQVGRLRFLRPKCYTAVYYVCTRTIEKRIAAAVIFLPFSSVKSKAYKRTLKTDRQTED